MYGKTCGERVRILRSQNAETMEAFGARIGGHLNTVRNWERGIALPSAESIMTICEEYNIRADWLRGLAPLDVMRPVGWNREAKNDRA